MKARQFYIKCTLPVSSLLKRNLILHVRFMQLQFTVGLWRVIYFGALVCCLVTVWRQTHWKQILTFCWPCISVYLSQYLTNLMHKICFTISFYFMPVHVLSTVCSSSEGQNCITQHLVSSHLVHETATYMCDDTRGCVMQFWPPDDEHMVLETCRGMK